MNNMKYLASVSLLVFFLLPVAWGQTSDFESTRALAEQGYARAQYNLVLMYTNGRGVPQNDVMGYVWSSVSAAQGHENAREARDIMSERLTGEQLAKGQEIATRCFESGYKDCN